MRGSYRPTKRRPNASLIQRFAVPRLGQLLVTYLVNIDKKAQLVNIVVLIFLLHEFTNQKENTRQLTGPFDRII